MYSDLPWLWWTLTQGGTPNQGHPPQCGLVPWLGSCFKCMSGGLSHGEIPNWGHHSPHGFEPCPGFLALSEASTRFSTHGESTVDSSMVSMQVSTAHGCGILKLGLSWHTGVVVPIWVFFLSVFLLRRATGHLLPCGGVLIYDDSSLCLSSGLCPCGTFPQRHGVRTAQPITAFSFVPLFLWVRRFTTAVRIWLFFSCGYSLHQHRGVWLH